MRARKVIKIAGKTLVGILTAVVAALLALQIPSVQTALASKILSDLEKQGMIDGKLSVGQANVTLGALNLEDVTILDPSEGAVVDTFFHAGSISARYNLLPLFSGDGLFLHRLSVSGGQFCLVSEEDGTTNLGRLLHLGSSDEEKEHKDRNIFKVDRLNIKDFRFRLLNPASQLPKRDKGIDWADLDVRDISIEGRDVRMRGKVMSGRLVSASMHEKSGYRIDELSGSASVGDGRADIRDFLLRDEFSSVDMPRILFSYPGNPHAWSKFTQEVRIDADISPSRLSLASLSYFAPSLSGQDYRLRIESKASGYVNDFKVSPLLFSSEDGMSGRVEGRIVGLPDSIAMGVDARVSDLRFTGSSLSAFIRGWAPEADVDLGGIAPGETFRFDGSMKGSLNDYLATGSLSQGGGSAEATLRIRNMLDPDRDMNFSGTVSTASMNFGTLLGTDILGEGDLRSSLSASLGKAGTSARIDTLNILTLNALGHTYRDISLVGNFDAGSFSGRLHSNDPAAKLDFRGSGRLPDGKGNGSISGILIADADLAAMGLDGKRQVSKVSFSAEADLSSIGGALLGSIDIENLRLTDEAGVHPVGEVNFIAGLDGEYSRISMLSDFADLRFVGDGTLPQFISDLQNATLRKFLPSLGRQKAGELSGASYSLTGVFHDSRQLLGWLKPGAYIEDSTSVSMALSGSGLVRASLRSHRLALGGKYLKDSEIDFHTSLDDMGILLVGDELSIPPLTLKDNNLTFSAKDDAFGLGLSFSNEGEASIAGSLGRDSQDRLLISGNVLPTSLWYDGLRWDIGDSRFSICGGDISIGNFSLGNGSQALLLDGGLSSTEADTLRVELKDLDLNLLNAFLGRDLAIGGKATGHARIISPTSEGTGILMGITAEDAVFGGEALGTLRLGSSREGESGDFRFFGRNDMDGRRTLDIGASFNPGSRSIRGRIRLDSLSLAYGTPFMDGLFSRMGGSLTGEVNFNGSLDSLSIRPSTLSLRDGDLLLDYTQVAYKAEGEIGLDDSGMHFDGLRLADSSRGRGSLSGDIGWDHLRDIRLGLLAGFENMQVLALPEELQQGFYGSVRASGRAEISGSLEDINLDISANTVGDGDFHIPMNTAVVNSSSDLLTFLEREKPVVRDLYEEMMAVSQAVRGQSSVGVRLSVGVTQGVEAMLEIDKSSGNVLSGRGTGHVDLEVRPDKDIFTLGGSYNISSGSYHFEQMGIVKKDFTIQDGSSVHFAGDVMDTQLDINALYRTKASIGTLIADSTSTTRRMVDCGISISGRLRNPQLAFSVEVPDLDPAIQGRVESALSTTDQLQKQFLSLLISGSFLPDQQSGIFNNSSMLNVTVSEIMANQLSNILQKLNIPVDLGLDYSQTSGGTDVFDLAISTALWDNRVIVNGEIGNRRYTPSGVENDVVGDLDIEIKMDKAGALRLGLFSHSADMYSNYLDNSQRNGVGVTYQKEFNRLGEFLRDIFTPGRKRRRERRAEREAVRQEAETKTIVIQADER